MRAASHSLSYRPQEQQRIFLSIDLSTVILSVRARLQTCFQFTHAHTLLMRQLLGTLVKLGVTLLTAVLGVKFQRFIHNKTKDAALHHWCSSYPYQLLMCAAPCLRSPSLSKLFGIFLSSLPPIWLVLGYCSLTINISQATFTSFLFFMLSAVFFPEFLGKLSSFSPACPKLSSALHICSPALLNLSHIGSADRYLHGEHFKSNVLLSWII